MGVVLPACTHPSLPLPVSPPVGLKNCFEDLPLAEGALNAPKTSYQFKGVKLVSPKVMAKLVRERPPDPPPPPPPPTPPPPPKNPSSTYKPPPAGSLVCAFAFTGSFPAGQVAQAPPTVSGKAAIVLTSTDRALLFSFVVAKLPETFSRVAHRAVKDFRRQPAICTGPTVAGREGFRRQSGACLVGPQPRRLEVVQQFAAAPRSVDGCARNLDIAPGFDLADALPSQVEMFAYFVQSTRFAPVQAKSQAKNFPFTLVQGHQHLAHLT